jgi:hypothetical protein
MIVLILLLINHSHIYVFSKPFYKYLRSLNTIVLPDDHRASS